MTRPIAEAESSSPDRLKVFISYSRRDASSADAIVDALTERGFNVLIDRRDLEFGEKWQAELAELIRQSDTVIWLISDASIHSEWVNWELDEVAKRNKRLVPVLIGDTPRAKLPRQLGEIHIFPADGLFDLRYHLDTLVRILETDRAWLKEASRLVDRSHEWHAGGRPPALLIRGVALTAAERWMDRRPLAAPPPAREVLDLLLASRLAATKRQRRWIAGSLVVAIGAIALTALAFFQRMEADRQRAVADQERAQAIKSEAKALAQEKLAAAERDTATKRLAESTSFLELVYRLYISRDDSESRDGATERSHHFIDILEELDKLKIRADTTAKYDDLLGRFHLRLTRDLLDSFIEDKDDYHIERAKLFLRKAKQLIRQDLYQENRALFDQFMKELHLQEMEIAYAESDDSRLFSLARLADTEFIHPTRVFHRGNGVPTLITATEAYFRASCMTALAQVKRSLPLHKDVSKTCAPNWSLVRGDGTTYAVQFSITNKTGIFFIRETLLLLPQHRQPSLRLDLIAGIAGLLESQGVARALDFEERKRVLSALTCAPKSNQLVNKAVDNVLKSVDGLGLSNEQQTLLNRMVQTWRTGKGAECNL